MEPLCRDEPGREACWAALLDRVDQLEPSLRALLSETDRRGRLATAAGHLCRAWPDAATRPPLYGCLVAVKDIIRVDGLLTRAGSTLPPELFAGPEASCVTALRRAGAVVLAKSVTTEFAHAEPGPTRNPRALGRTPGGSSSGSAAAVAAGYCPLALGTQTIGSVIRPAAFCGVVGFKPTRGRVAGDGVIPFSPSVDTVGWLGPDVASVVLAAACLCQEWRPPGAGDKPVLVIPRGPYLAQAEPAARAVLGCQLAALTSAGYRVCETDALLDIEAVNERHRLLVAGEMARVHAAWFTTHAARYRPRTAALVRQGQSVSTAALAAARRGSEALDLELRAALAAVGGNAWVCPAACGPAPAGLEGTGDPVMNLPWSHAGWPVVTVPGGLVDGLPVGLQLAAPPGTDEALLGWAAGIETWLGQLAGAGPQERSI